MIVQLEDNASTAALASALKPDGYHLVARGETSDQLIISLPDQAPESVQIAMERIKALPDVIGVTPLYYDGQ
ncbi:MAG: hypothetical protein ACQKBV_07660 [Puniceicoccales bacterium]